MTRMNQFAYGMYILEYAFWYFLELGVIVMKYWVWWVKNRKSNSLLSFFVISCLFCFSFFLLCNLWYALCFFFCIKQCFFNVHLSYLWKKKKLENPWVLYSLFDCSSCCKIRTFKGLYKHCFGYVGLSSFRHISHCKLWHGQHC